eukprot:9165154-Alexandrium_andersonii.AAC.1
MRAQGVWIACWAPCNEKNPDSVRLSRFPLCAAPPIGSVRSISRRVGPPVARPTQLQVRTLDATAAVSISAGAARVDRFDSLFAPLGELGRVWRREAPPEQAAACCLLTEIE